MFGIFLNVFPTYQYLNRYFAAFERFQMLCYSSESISAVLTSAADASRATFFGRGHDIECFCREEKEGTRKLITKQPKLESSRSAGYILRKIFS